MGVCHWSMVLAAWIVMCNILETSQHTRNKRQIQPELPRILTQNGHMVFQTGTNHNISFSSRNGGHININGESVSVIAQLVKNNKQAIDQLQTSPTASTGVASRLTTVENRLNNLQPTGQVQTQLLTLGHRIDLVQATFPSDVGPRLSQVESSLNNLQASGQVQDLIDGLTTRLTRVERTVRRGGSATSRRISRSIRRVTRRVTRLQTTVRNLQNLLTIDECDSNPCQNGGTCVDTYNGYICQCPASFQGQNCNDDVNECAIYAGTDLGCANGATCINTIGSFTCQCATNWHGVRCTESHDDCTGASSAELCGHGTCVNVQRTSQGQAKYTCICNDGWTKAPGSDPACTVDRNECTEAGRPVCSVDPLVTCINLPGSFTCGACPAGYSGNGFSCVDVNECAVNNGGCSMTPMVQCINTPGSRECGPCPDGFQGSGLTCTWVGMCGNNNGGCFPSASCTESPGFQGRVCTCPPGYVGNGVGAAGCTSQGPITGACGSTPCMNGAACQNVVSTGSYRCVCLTGYSGQNCETNINECSSNPCQNGGSCSDRVNGYMCQCSEGHTGANCEEATSQCGAALTGESGTFRYPAVPGTQYPHEVSCAWRITTTRGKMLIVTFPTFNIEYHVDCSYDFVQVNDGPTAASHPIGRYCGSSAPNNGQPINSTDNQIYFWFKSDQSVTNDGFSVQWRSAMPVCGGHLEDADHGEFSSPGYPGLYPHDRDCVWIISVSPGKKVMFSFARIAIETHPNCSYDYLEFRDGDLDTSPVLRKYCNSTIPPPLTTTGPSARVLFHSDSSENDQGFHITYSAIAADPGCGGTFTTETGTLISPNYPNLYNHDATCVWIIRVHDQDQVTLTFTNLDIESHETCNFDYVEVRDGSDDSAPLIGSYCGSTIPTPLTTTGNVMYVKFVSDESVAGAGFRATWRVGCGGTFSSPTDVLRSPYYPDNYPSNRMCEYFIVQPTGYTITLSFNAFDVEGNGCGYDYLEVRDGGASSSPLLGTFCGTEVPDPQMSSSNLMYLKFVSDGSEQNNGFEATYAASEQSCGGSLTSETGAITSPGHPNNMYPHGVNCTWYIHVDPGLVIRLTFNSFVMEHNRNCNYDSVSLYDNSSAVPSSLIGKYCGTTNPPVTTTTNNVMTIVMQTDSSLAYEGFHASYVALNASTVCGRDLVDPSGVITSPNFPNYYPHQRECTWTITAAEGNQILLNITDFALERDGSRCQYDYLEIRNGGFPSSPLAGKYCGTTIDRIIVSHSNRMYIRFVTDNSISDQGFKLLYETTATGCGADLTTATGSFVSPNYPMPYGHNAECFWTITVSKGSKVQLTIIDMDVEANSGCSYDYLEVRNTGPNGGLLGRFCGTSVPGPLTSSGNVVWVKYRTDYSVAGRGFHAFYNSICQNTLTDYSGVIESPNFPNAYPHNSNCTWIIAVAMGNTVNIAFSHFRVETHWNCQFDFLQIRDGGIENATEIGRYCGNDLPSPITSTTDHVWLHFESDHSLAYHGFRLEYITEGCGGFLQSPTGTFTSPNYPNPYPHRRQCEWKIIVETGQAVELTVASFDVGSDDSCLYDVLEIYGGPDDSAPRLSQLCKTYTTPQILSSTGNEMFVRFKSDNSVAGTGFTASYKAIQGGCGGNITTQSGTILSKNYPNEYPHNTDCEWLITVQELHSVMLTFTDFDVEGSSDCRYDYVAVYDGADATYPELIKACGTSIPSPSILRSHSNMMFIRMRTDGSQSGRGFKANFVTGCGGTLNADTDGELTSPNYPGSYPRQSNCSWLIQAGRNSDRITLTFTHLHLEEHGTCDYDYVIVYDGNDENAPMSGRYCGTTIPSAITSQGSALFVQFMADSSVQGAGFRATYSKSSSSCGADFTGASGSFMSPGYPNSYPVSTECVWTFSVSPGSKVHVSFSVFNIEEDDYCNSDYVELHEGQLGGPLLGRFCGNSIPSNLTAYNGLWMKFRSDESNTGQGFVGQFAAVYGGEVTGTSGQIASPLYPYQYPHNVNYAWTITVPTGMRIQVSFVTMDMERDPSFNADVLAFRDGGSVNSPILRRYEGTVLPDVFMSTTNQLYVTFRSDWSGAGQGFLFNWEATSSLPMSTVVPTSGTSPIPGCGGTLNVTDEIQTLVSPGYPYGYQDNLVCTWNLMTDASSRIWMNITDIDLESHSSCNYDNVRIYRNLDARGLQIGEFCGRNANPQPIISYRNEASIRFTTDMSRNYSGFALQYKTACGGRLWRVVQGSLRSPGFPNSYPPNSSCSWYLSASRGRTLRVTFVSFNIQGTQGSCAGDYIELLNGNSVSSPPLGNATNGRYCGNSAPSSMVTSGNALTVNFITDGSGSGPGFNLTYTEVQVACGGRRSLDQSTRSGTFTSLNYPEPYTHNMDCVWVITAPANENIQLQFVESFNIESHSRCRWDYVELRDGGTINAPSLAKFCGTQRPRSVTSTGNVMYVRFRTDSSVGRTGFKAVYKIGDCGGHYTPTVSAPVTITSPNYPSNYDNNKDCIWTFGGPFGHFLTFTFTSFNVQSTANCSGDFVEIRELNSTGPVLTNACGFTIPASVSTADQYGYVRFKTDGTGQMQGFSLTVTVSYEECGAELNTPSGTFQSPNFPDNYPHSRRCEWKITVPEGRKVSITFDPFNIESSRYCRKDYVQIYNGIYADSPSLQRYCGESPPPSPVMVSGNTAKVSFVTDGSNSNGGFRATYSSLENADCGGRLMTAPGNISSPGYEAGNYTNNLQCVWTLVNQQYTNSSIVIHFRNLKLERHTLCRYDWLEIREGDSIDGLILNKFCGNNTYPDSIITPLGSVWMRFRTDRSIVDHGFFLQYNFTQCGGILTSSAGVITSPNYPNNYGHNDACAWQINAPEGMQISVVVDDFIMERHSSCRFDYLELFNGPYASSPSIGKFCHNNTPPVIKSQTNSVRIVFYTDSSISAKGFRLHYAFQSEGCGGTIHQATGNLNTPNFPRSYPHNAECVWDIYTEPGFHVSLTFNPPFDMENAGDCQQDYVEVSDALSNGTLRSLGRWCGNILPPVLNSTGRRLVVKFRSDPGTNGNGFSATWVSGCGGIISGVKGGYLTSPRHPNLYPNNLNCNYTLLLDPDHFTNLAISSANFDIESGGNCRFDALSIYEGNSSDGRNLGKFCGTTPPEGLSARGTVFINFKTDGSVQRTGFSLSYRVSECGGVFTSPNGLIRTPTYPTNYHNNLNCTWSITVDPNQIIRFKFSRFELEPHSLCQYDYVDIFDGPSLTSPLIGRYCGEVVPRDMIRSTSNTMMVNFVTDGDTTRGGFFGVYYSTYGPAHGCGGYLNSSSGGFSSVDGDGDGGYENNLNCPWLIMAPNNKVIQLSFSGFDLEAHDNCRYDYLKIYDGMSDEDRLVGAYCGSDVPPTFTSTSNSLYVVFYTDSSINGTGFNATYVTQDAACGGTYISTSTPQTITSPGYPTAFRQDVSCRWTIDGPTPTDKVEVNVTALNLQSSTGCSPEYLEIRDYPLGFQGRSVHACGGVPPSLFDSFGQTVQINYVATSGESTGFSLTFKTANCNRTYTENQGQIYSPGWPGVYPQNVNCQILIQGPAGSTVSLYFNSFQIEPHQNCDFDYLQVHNGSDATSPVIRKICGWMIPDPIFATTNAVWLNFVTDASIAHPGFDITYTTTTQGVGCGGNITGINGSLTSPGYPGNYSSQTTCTWLITVPARRQITLTFGDMRMFDTVNCGTDYVILYNGNSDTSSMFGRYCGGEIPAPLQTSSNVAFVKFVSDGVGTSIGFRLSFTS